MKSIKEFDISLESKSYHLNINNSIDTENIDKVLGDLIKCNRKEEMEEILKNTSFKYLKRLQNDGILNFDMFLESNNIIFENIFLTNKGRGFFKSGGYKKLYSLKESKIKNFLTKWWWGFLGPIIIGLITYLITLIF